MSERAPVFALFAATATLLAACQAREAPDAEQGGAKGPPPAAFPPMEKAQGAEVTQAGARLAAGQDGERLFLRRCGVCHLDGGMGTMVLARRLPPAQATLQGRRDLQRDAVIQVVREGVGAMPRLTRVDVTDPELAAIADYLARRPQ